MTRILSQAGISYEDVPLYDVKSLGLEGRDLAETIKGLDYLTFASGSGVESFLENLAEEDRNVLKETTLTAIGDVTAKVLEQAGFPADRIAGEFSISGLAECILEDAVRTR